MKRSSTSKLDFRKLLVDVKQQKGYWELALEQLLEIQRCLFYSEK